MKSASSRSNLYPKTTVTRVELVHFLKQRLVEQGKVDNASRGTSTLAERIGGVPKETPTLSDVQLVFPPERKQLRHNRKLFLERGSYITSYSEVTRRLCHFLRVPNCRARPPIFRVRCADDSGASSRRSNHCDDQHARVVATGRPGFLEATSCTATTTDDLLESDSRCDIEMQRRWP